MKNYMENIKKFLKFFWRWTYILLTPVLSFLVFRVILYLLFGFPIIMTECIFINIVVTSGISFKFAEYSKEYHSKLLFYILMANFSVLKALLLVLLIKSGIFTPSSEGLILIGDILNCLIVKVFFDNFRYIPLVFILSDIPKNVKILYSLLIVVLNQFEQDTKFTQMGFGLYFDSAKGVIVNRPGSRVRGGFNLLEGAGYPPVPLHPAMRVPFTPFTGTPSNNDQAARFILTKYNARLWFVHPQGGRGTRFVPASHLGFSPNTRTYESQRALDLFARFISDNPQIDPIAHSSIQRGDLVGVGIRADTLEAFRVHPN